MKISTQAISTWFHQKAEAAKEMTAKEILWSVVSYVPKQIRKLGGQLLQVAILDRKCFAFLDSKNYVRTDKYNLALTEIGELKDQRQVLIAQKESLIEVNGLLTEQRNLAQKHVGLLRRGTKEYVEKFTQLLDVTVPVTD